MCIEIKDFFLDFRILEDKIELTLYVTKYCKKNITNQYNL